MKLRIFLICAVLISLAGLFGITQGNAGATVCFHNCAPSATPTPSPSPTPKPCDKDHWSDDKNCKPSPTPTPSTTPPCIVWHGEFPVPCPSITPTPTATPTATITPPQPQGNAGSDGGSSDPGATQPHSCGDTTPGNVPNFAVVVKPNGMELDWAIIPGADSIDIRYGLNNGSWIYGALNIPNTGNYLVQGLKTNHAYWYEIAGVHGCAVGNWSNAIDPIYRGK